MIVGSFLFTIITITFFTFLDLKNRAVPRNYINFTFCISFCIYVFYDFLIQKTVNHFDLILGTVCFCLCYLFMTPGVMSKIIGPADVRILSRFLFLTPVYTYSTIGMSLIPAIDFFLNFIMTIIPTVVIFKIVEPDRPVPALVAISAALIITMTVGNIPSILYNF